MSTSISMRAKVVSLAFAAFLFATLSAMVPSAHASCASPANAIEAENCLPGNPSSEWDVSTGDAGDLSIQGFATDISVNVGGTVYFKVATDARQYTMKIYRMGFYGGMGARLVGRASPRIGFAKKAVSTSASNSR